MMKKLFALILSLVMMTALTVPAFAVDPQAPNKEPGQDVEISVTGTYASTNDNTPVYSIDIDWAGMDFTYTETFGWNENDKGYTTVTGRAWSEAGTITVANNSNVPVEVEMDYETKKTTDNADITVDIEGALTVGGESYTGSTVNSSGNVEAKFAITGGQLKSGADQVPIATITVTLAAVAQ